MPAPAADDAAWRFVDALAFNWIVAGTDAHAKNYSLLLVGAQVRLAPLYDIASALPYDDSRGHQLRLAMKLGGEYRLLATDRPGTWRRTASELGLDQDAVVERVTRLVRRVPDAFAEAADEPDVRDLASTLPDRMVDAVASRAARCGGVVW